MDYIKQPLSQWEGSIPRYLYITSTLVRQLDAVEQTLVARDVGTTSVARPMGIVGLILNIVRNISSKYITSTSTVLIKLGALLVGCQPDYGRCGDAPEPTPTPTPTPTPAPPSSPPVISSSSTIVPTTSSVLPPLPSGTLIVSPNGQCGNVTTCAGSTFGRCCSEYYYCGNSPAFCGTGCRPGFGACDGGLPPIVSSSVPVPIPPTSSVISSSSLSLSTTSINIPTPTSTPTPSSTAAPVPTNVSTNGRCGPEGNGMTCQGSSFGRCCSDYGWCGNLSPDFCSVAWGCRPQFGSCG
ncbi:hypothetical protein IAQ61_000742 [Plenodomus lingam]|uniref:uncharacterized protein n=1 Tax=Leptosphaeria maculans TaxID=5022 RepID=UPI0033300FE8|nr:hypothetical protein IAQ61_000742 [Plenodomus lingam]